MCYDHKIVIAQQGTTTKNIIDVNMALYFVWLSLFCVVIWSEAVKHADTHRHTHIWNCMGDKITEASQSNEMKRSTKMENTSTMKFKNNGLALWQYRNEGHANQPYQYMHIVCIMRCIHQILLCPNNYVVSFFVNIAISCSRAAIKLLLYFSMWESF